MISLIIFISFFLNYLAKSNLYYNFESFTKFFFTVYIATFVLSYLLNPKLALVDMQNIDNFKNLYFLPNEKEDNDVNKVDEQDLK